MPTAEAKITKVRLDESTGWYEIQTDNQDIRKLTTKIAAKASEASALKQQGALAIIEYTSKPRTLADGRTFQNYYYDSAIASDEPSPADDGIERVSPPARKTDPSDAWRICLGAGAKLAVATLPLMPDEQRDFDTQKRIAIAWARFIYSTPYEQAPPSSAQSSLDDLSQYDSPPPHGDEDIPF